jgi:aryl-alcohol dehydrogenase-like predicted oxidoreductase
MLHQTLGKTGLQVSPVVFGGIIVMNATDEEAAGWVKEAVDNGVNYFDVAPTYGNAETMLGPALEPYRKDVYLACKTTQRKGEDAKRELDRSLELLRTDHFDVYQLHAMTTNEDMEQAFAADGVMNMVLKARDEGIIRHIGFSAHSEKTAVELCRRFNFESILYPMNWVMGLNTGWGDGVAKIVEEKNIGLLAMKSLAQRKYRDNEREVFPKSWCKTNFPDSVEEDRLGLLGMKYALYKGANTLVPPGDIWHFRFMLRNVDKALQEPLTTEELVYMKQVAAGWKNEMILDAIHETA